MKVIIENASSDRKRRTPDPAADGIARRRLPLEEPARWAVLLGGMLALVALAGLTHQQARAACPS